MPLIAGPGRSRRRLVRAAALVLAAGAVAVVGVATVRHLRTGAVTARVRPADGVHVTGLRHVGADDGCAFRVRAAELGLRRVRVGPFRLGFARELLARDLDIDMRLKESRGRPSSVPSTGWRRTTSGVAITTIQVDGLRIRARRPGADFEISAGRGEIGWADGAVARLRGQVRVRGERLDVTVPALDFDPRVGRFVPASPAADQASVARINAALARVGPTVAGPLVRLSSRLSGLTRSAEAAGW